MGAPSSSRPPSGSAARPSVSPPGGKNADHGRRSVVSYVQELDVTRQALGDEHREAMELQGERHGCGDGAQGREQRCQ